jgi:predicted HAD superfamily Cof-like phosphohydrolase
MHPAQRQVREFHEAFELGAPDALEASSFPVALRIRLIEEEAAEFATAARAGDAIAVIDAICDLLYVTYGAAVSLGVDIEPFFDEVHRSNMAKIGGTRRSDGKWIKPAGWQPPNLARILEEQHGTSTA